MHLLSKTGREYVLAKALSSLTPTYDVILIDCPPSLGLRTINGLTAAQEVLVPLQCETLSHRGMGQLLETIEDVKFQITTIAASAGSYGYSSSSTADLSHTAEWGGFVEVRDSSNNLVSSYSFSSASGADFTKPIQAVPEPGTCALLVLSGVAFNLIRSRRRKG